jgi:ketosteroid isomerase-like protein
VLVPSGILPDSTEMHGHDGLVCFAWIQAEAVEGFRVEPKTFIDAGEKVVVPLRFGGRAAHTGLPLNFDVVHVCTVRDGKWTRLETYPTEEDALKAVGLKK